MALMSLEERVAYLEKQVVRLQDRNEIENLVGKYETLHTPQTNGQIIDLFAMNQPDVSIEVADWGVYIGPKQIRTFFLEILKTPVTGTAFQHLLTTPMIVVAGDGKTAKGVWFSPGHETLNENGKYQAYWCYAKYGADFIKKEGKWKIWHWHLYDTFKTPYEKSWVEANPNELPPSVQQYPPDKPPTCLTAYSTSGIQKAWPPCPEPYETWGESKLSVV